MQVPSVRTTRSQRRGGALAGPTDRTGRGIAIEGVTKSFSGSRGTVLALDDVGLDVAPGEFVSVVGPSGCGKSTLLYMIAGFIQPDSGRIEVGGQPVTAPGPDRGVVFQEYALFPWRTVLGNVTYGLEQAGVGKRERIATAREHIAAVGLQGFEERYPKELSGGMKQRVAIARTLAHSPSTLLLDEPYGALDAQTREQMQDQLRDIWRDTGTTVLMITHDVPEAVFLSQRVLVMTARPGTIRAVVPIDLDRTQPREEIVVSDYYNEVKNEVWLAVREEVRRASGDVGP